MHGKQWMEWLALAAVCVGLGCVSRPEAACHSNDECDSGEYCISGECVALGSCIPSTCETLKADCGRIADGCGGALECGICAEGLACGAVEPNVCGLPCIEEADAAFCARLGKNCGTVTAADNCGRYRAIECGSCDAALTCSASNVCECVPPLIVPVPRDEGSAFKLVTGEDYRYVIPGASRGTALAASYWDVEKGSRLDFLKWDEASGVPGQPIAVSWSAGLGIFKSSPYSVRDGVVVYAAPARAYFSELHNGTKTLKWVDLATGASLGVPDSTDVADGSIVFGANGGEILFVRGAAASSAGGQGEMFWSNGVTATRLGVHTTGSPILLDEARTTAFLTLSSVGESRELVAVTMATGEKTSLYDDVRVVNGLAQFSVSADGSRVVVASASGPVLLLDREQGSSTELAASGELPAISADGSTAAYVSGGKLMAWRGGETAPIADTVPSHWAPPVLSVDGAWVVFFDHAAWLGDGALGTAFVSRTDGTLSPLLLGDEAGVTTVRFLGPAGTVTHVAAVVGLKDLTGAGSFRSLGHLVLVTLESRTRQEVGRSVFASDFVALDRLGELAFIGEIVRGPGIGSAFVAARGEKSVPLGQHVLPRSMRAGPMRDDVLFLGDCSSRDYARDSSRLCRLYARGETSCGREALLPESALAVAAEFTPEGRVLAVVPTGRVAGVWSLPIP